MCDSCHVTSPTLPVDLYLNAWKSDSRRGIGSNHECNKSGAQISKHVGKLRNKQKMALGDIQ